MNGGQEPQLRRYIKKETHLKRHVFGLFFGVIQRSVDVLVLSWYRLMSS